MIRRVREGLVWRWRRYVRGRYLRTTFRNGTELARSYQDRTACDAAVCRDGSVIRHPAGRTGLAGMILEIWRDEVYTGAFYTPAPGDVVIDAGANVGLFSLLLARRQPRCSVFAFEPFEENYRLLTENLAAAGASTVRPFPYALGAESGTATMSDGGGRSQDHVLRSGPPADPSLSAVRTCALAEVIRMTGADTVQLFKCDIEGSEYDLFAAAPDDALRRVERYAIEYHDNLRPGTLDLLVRRLDPTHRVESHPAGETGYGMLYAVRRAGVPDSQSRRPPGGGPGPLAGLAASAFRS